MAVTTAPANQLRSLIGFLLGVALVITGLTMWQGWALPVVLSSVFIMVMGHEFGHFITAKRAGMKVTDFFVGFGPVLWSTTRGETRYGVRALLLGGYVKVPGMTWGETLDPALEPRTYRSASYPRKVVFASAGSLMHVVMALLIAWASLTFIGAPNPRAIGISGFEVWQGHPTNVAQAAGFKSGDQILSIDGRATTGVSEVVAMVRTHAGDLLTVVVARNGHDLTLHARPEDGRTLKVNGVPLATGSTPQGFLGVELQELVQSASWYSAIPRSFTLVTTTIGQALHAMVHVFSPGEFTTLYHQVTTPALAKSTKSQYSRPVSIVGVVRIADQAAQSNEDAFFRILMSLNIFVGVLNMVPMLPLDGGYVAVATYERLRRRRGVTYHADVNKLAPVVYAFMAVLLLLFISTLYLDIVYPITNPFR